MKSNPRDPLLSIARFALMASIVVMAVSAGALALAAPALLIGEGAVIAHLAAEGVTAGEDLVFAGAAVLLALAALFAVGTWFLVLLRRIVLSVGEGDPFVPANAERLARMGWITLGTQIATIPVGALVHFIAVATREARDIHIQAEFGFSGGMILLTLVLFILARVFREGTRLREELEGTV